MFNRFTICSSRPSSRAAINYRTLSPFGHTHLNIWGVPPIGGTPKSSMCRWIFPNKNHPFGNNCGVPPWLWKPPCIFSGIKIQLIHPPSPGSSGRLLQKLVVHTRRPRYRVHIPWIMSQGWCDKACQTGICGIPTVTSTKMYQDQRASANVLTNLWLLFSALLII